MMSRWAPWWSGIRHTHIHTYIHTQTHIREVHDNFLEFQMTIWSCSFWLKFFSVHFWTQNLRRMCCKSYLLDIIRISKSIFYTDYLSVASRVSKHKIWCAIRMFCLLFQTRIDHRTSDATGTHSTSCGNSGSTNMLHLFANSGLFRITRWTSLNTHVWINIYTLINMHTRTVPDRQPWWDAGRPGEVGLHTYKRT